METPFKAPLTPEQVAAMKASGGFAQCEDPTTNILYQLIQFQPPVLDEDYVREKIEEAYGEAAENGFEPFDMAAVKAELNRRLAAKEQPRR